MGRVRLTHAIALDPATKRNYSPGNRIDAPAEETRHSSTLKVCAHLKRCVSLTTRKKGMRGNNYNLKTRDMSKAGSFAMNREVAAGSASFSTAATVSERFDQFAAYAKEAGLRRLEEVSRDLVTSYGQGLANQCPSRNMRFQPVQLASGSGG